MKEREKRKYYYTTMNWSNGRIFQRECTDHKYAYSGSMPCTGTYRCILCGYVPEKDHMGRKQ